MCEPATILTGVSLAVAAGGAASSIAGQSQANSAAKQVEGQKSDAVNDQIAGQDQHVARWMLLVEKYKSQRAKVSPEAAAE